MSDDGLRRAALDLAQMVMTLTGSAVPQSDEQIRVLAEMRARACLVIGELEGRDKLLEADAKTQNTWCRARFTKWAIR